MEEIKKNILYSLKPYLLKSAEMIKHGSITESLKEEVIFRNVSRTTLLKYINIRYKNKEEELLRHLLTVLSNEDAIEYLQLKDDRTSFNDVNEVKKHIAATYFRRTIIDDILTKGNDLILQNLMIYGSQLKKDGIFQIMYILGDISVDLVLLSLFHNSVETLINIVEQVNKLYRLYFFLNLPKDPAWVEICKNPDPSYKEKELIQKARNRNIYDVDKTKAQLCRELQIVQDIKNIIVPMFTQGILSSKFHKILQTSLPRSPYMKSYPARVLNIHFTDKPVDFSSNTIKEKYPLEVQYIDKFGSNFDILISEASNNNLGNFLFGAFIKLDGEPLLDNTSIEQAKRNKTKVSHANMFFVDVSRKVVYRYEPLVGIAQKSGKRINDSLRRYFSKYGYEMIGTEVYMQNGAQFAYTGSLCVFYSSYFAYRFMKELSQMDSDLEPSVKIRNSFFSVLRAVEKETKNIEYHAGFFEYILKSLQIGDVISDFTINDSLGNNLEYFEKNIDRLKLYTLGEAKRKQKRDDERRLEIELELDKLNLEEL